MIITFFTIIAIIAVGIGSLTDIKTLEVPDWLNYSLIAIGLGGNLIFSIVYWDAGYILRSLLGFAIALALGFLMFYTGQTGGGDSKMIFGLGAMFGFSYNLGTAAILDNFFLKFLINVLFAGAVYGLAWVVYMGIKNRKRAWKKIKMSLADKNLKRIRLISGILAVISLAFIYLLSQYIDAQFRLPLTLLVLLLYFTNYLFIIVKSIEDISMIKFVEPEKLTEGDWIVDEIKIDGKYITGPKDLGIEKSKIAKLIKLKHEGKIHKIKVKYGIPFVPSFFVALVYTVITNQIVLLQFMR